MQNSIFVVFPPMLVLFLAITTRRVVFSLCAGIIFASLIAHNFAIFESSYSLFKTVLMLLSDISTLYTFGFLIMLGALSILVTNTGGIAAYTEVLKKYIRSPKSAQISSLLFSHFFFIDDYLSSLTVGNIMRPITDKYLIARTKLAYLIDSASGALCLIIPASSWLAVIIPQLRASGISLSPFDSPKIIADPFSLYVEIIPFIFYPLFGMLGAWFVVLFDKSYGSMAIHEKKAKAGDLFNGEKPIAFYTETKKGGSSWYFIVPLLTLIFLIFGGILISGDSALLGGSHSIIETIEHTNIIQVLFLSSLITVSLSMIFFTRRNIITIKDATSYLKEGALSMKGSILLLLCAWVLASLIKNDLQTGKYIADNLLGTFDKEFFPLMFFITATFISAATGSSWGTIHIMLPIAIPMLCEFIPYNFAHIAENVPLLLPSLGAIFSGSLAGAHISPLSDATVTASTGAGSHHIDHVKTQFAYTIVTILGTIIAYISTAFFANLKHNYALSFSLGIGTIALLHTLLHKKEFKI